LQLISRTPWVQARLTKPKQRLPNVLQLDSRLIEKAQKATFRSTFVV
jgi:hypothetical protein